MQMELKTLLLENPSWRNPSFITVWYTAVSKIYFFLIDTEKDVCTYDIHSHIMKYG